MEADSQTMEAFLRLIHEIDRSSSGPALNLTVRYVGDDHAYEGFPPCGDEPFVEEGLRDPALGNTGPISFTDIASVTVHDEPRHQRHSDQYKETYLALLNRVASVPGILVGRNSVSFSQ